MGNVSANRSDIERAVKKSLAEYFNIPQENIKLSAKLVEDLGLDSFGMVELRFELKKKLGINMTAETLRKITVVNDIVEMILEETKNKM